MHRIAAYIAADGTVHKDKTDAAVADIAHIISAKLEAPKAYDPVGLRDAHIRMAAHAILVAADQVREILNQYIDPCDFLIRDYVEPPPAPPRPSEHIADAEEVELVGPADSARPNGWAAYEDKMLRDFVKAGRSWEVIGEVMSQPTDWLRARHAFLTQHDAERPAPVDTIDA